LNQLTQRVNQLESGQSQLWAVVHREAGGAALWLFGAFCALWAQNTNRNAWLWFFLGLFFSVITVIVLLVKNSHDREQKSPGI
jgi:Na+/melibiose symporter-like transporter